MGCYGEDWAGYQSAAPSTKGLSFAFTKVTEGLTYVNPHWTTQHDDAKSHGLLWGAYHYPHMSNSATAEADHFLGKVTWKSGDMIVLDWEGYDAANKGVPHSVQAAYKDTWLKHVKAKMPHHRVGMYCNEDYWKNVDTSGYYGDFLWIATAGRPAGSPGIQAAWLFHQYSSSSVDKDFCHLSAADLKTWTLALETPPKPTPAPAPKPTPAPAPKPAPKPVPKPAPKPAPKPKAPPFPTGIAPGKSSPSAKTLQGLLKKTGWLANSVPLSNNYGPKTQAAVAGFNSKHKLNSPGKSHDPAIGKQGWALLCTYVYG